MWMTLSQCTCTVFSAALSVALEAGFWLDCSRITATGLGLDSIRIRFLGSSGLRTQSGLQLDCRIKSGLQLDYCTLGWIHSGLKPD
jgi:hypothetical protein